MEGLVQTFGESPPGSLVALLHSDGYCLAAAAQNKAAAWTFIEFANSAAGQSLIAMRILRVHPWTLSLVQIQGISCQGASTVNVM